MPPANYDHMRELLSRITSRNADGGLYDEFIRLLDQHPEAAVIDAMEEYFEQQPLNVPPEVASASAPEWHAILKKVLNADKQATIQVQNAAEVTERPAHRIHFLKTSWFKWAAAVFLIITGISVYYTISHSSQPGTAVVRTVPPPKSGDVAPGFSRAVLTLSDGRKVELDSSASETIMDQTLSIENNDGQLIYKNAELVAVNTMTTPKGGQYQLTLADGTRVWLNAASSITYPTAFTGKFREVTITGEAYFEVKSNKEKPFIVKSGADQITVLGTAFNVNTYANEPAPVITLLEGSVKINSSVLRPGQAYSEGRIFAAQTEEAIAWKNGYFYFNNVDLQTIMRQVERWYDVEVVYEGEVPAGHYRGKPSRSLPLSQILELVRYSGVDFRIEGKRIIIPSK